MQVAEATKSCLRAHILRYGVVSDAVLRSLLEARSRTQHYLGRWAGAAAGGRWTRRREELRRRGAGQKHGQGRAPTGVVMFAVSC